MTNGKDIGHMGTAINFSKPETQNVKIDLRVKKSFRAHIMKCAREKKTTMSDYVKRVLAHHTGYHEK